MAVDLKKWRKWLKEHLEKKFLLIIRNEETLEQTASYRLTLQNLYLLACSLILIFGIVFFFLIIFTPIKKYIPGYGELSSQSEYVLLEKKLQELDKNIRARDTYIDAYERVLDGKPEKTSDIAKNVQIKLVKPEVEPKVKEDSLLRAEFEAVLAKERKGKANSSENARPSAFIKSGSSNSYDYASVPLHAPCRGPLGARYNPENGHLGVDIIAAKNTPIKATLEGTVMQADWSIENGHTIAIQHENNLVSMYKHNSAILKKVGVRVKSGEAIAIIGNTGSLTDGPHLHFELWYKGKPVDPTAFIRF